MLDLFACFLKMLVVVYQGPATISYIFCAFFGFQVLFGLLKVKKLDQREKLITGTA